MALLPIVASIAIVCVVNGTLWWQRVYPGFFVWQNGFVAPIGALHDAAVAAGVRYPSRVIAVDGEPVADRATVERLVSAQPVGSPFRYTLTRHGASYDVEIGSARLAAGTFWVTIGNFLVNALALLVVGAAIIFLEPESRAARAFFAFSVVWGLFLATSVDLVGPSWFQPLYFFLVGLCPVTALHAALEFPGVPPRAPRLRAALPALYALSVVFGVASVVAFHRSHALLAALDRLGYLALAASGFAALAIIVAARRRATSAQARQRLDVLLFGIAMAFIVPAGVLVMVYAGDTVLPLNYLTLGFAIFPAAMAYAIARHQLFGVDRIVRRTVAYVVVTAVIIVVYSAFLAYVDYVVLPDLSASPVVHVLVTMLLVALFNPLRGRIQALVDLVYFRAPYDYRRTVAAASQALASILDLDELLARLVGIITHEMQVERAEVWLPDGGDYRREGAPATSIAADCALIRQLTEHPRPILLVEGSRGGRIPAAVLDDLRAIDAALVVPLYFEQRLAGFLALGEKRSGRFYSADDLELLATLANQAAVAVQNARAYRALTVANRELREARDQLVEAERLAAIGELSAAVAHGIRNPLAGIKTGAELAMREARPDDPLRERFADILTEADALDSRINELLDFARPFVPHPALTDLNEVVAGAVHLLRRQITERGVIVETALAADLPVHELDAAQIEQVCLALVMNAIESMGRGGTLRVATARAGDGIEIVIRDTGHGIAPADLPKIFRLFHTRKARGTGVGLAIVKRIVEGHHGQIQVASTVGSGTEFRVYLPLHPAAAGVGASPPALRAVTGAFIRS